MAQGFANYSSEKFKWENSAEIRNGWVKPGDDKIQKTDDKVEFTSRVGVSAFKKWYYSSEADFETQFFDGFKYPDRIKPISGFSGSREVPLQNRYGLQTQQELFALHLPADLQNRLFP